MRYGGELCFYMDSAGRRGYFILADQLNRAALSIAANGTAKVRQWQPPISTPQDETVASVG
jgi:hypothetical protein